MSIFTLPAIWYLVMNKMQRHVRERIEFRVFERKSEGGALFVFTMKHNSKYIRVEVTIEEKILEHLNNIQVSDIVLRRACQKFEEQGINIPLNEEVEMEEEIPQKILKEICTKLEGTNIVAQIDNNALDGIVFEFHDLGEDLYVNVVVSKELTENMTLDILASAIFRHMQREFEAKGVNVPVLEESDKPVVHSVDDVSNFIKPNIPGFGAWG